MLTIVCFNCREINKRVLQEGRSMHCLYLWVISAFFQLVIFLVFSMSLVIVQTLQAIWANVEISITVRMTGTSLHSLTHLPCHHLLTCSYSIHSQTPKESGLCTGRVHPPVSSSTLDVRFMLDRSRIEHCLR